MISRQVTHLKDIIPVRVVGTLALARLPVDLPRDTQHRASLACAWRSVEKHVWKLIVLDEFVDWNTRGMSAGVRVHEYREAYWSR